MKHLGDICHVCGLDIPPKDGDKNGLYTVTDANCP